MCKSLEHILIAFLILVLLSFIGGCFLGLLEGIMSMSA